MAIRDAVAGSYSHLVVVCISVSPDLYIGILFTECDYINSSSTKQKSLSLTTTLNIDIRTPKLIKHGGGIREQSTTVYEETLKNRQRIE